MTAPNFEKINLLEVYNTIKKFDIICLLESYLSNDHPNNVKRGSVCGYIGESLPVRCPNSKNDYVVSLHQFPSQTTDEFGSFIKNLEKLIIDMSSRKADFVL